jgi:hypothetical protein
MALALRPAPLRDAAGPQGSRRAVIRPATDAEVAAIYRSERVEHIVGTVHGRAVAYIAFKTVEGRRWGMFGMLADAEPRVRVALFYAFRRRLGCETQPVHVVAGSPAAARLLRLLGFVETPQAAAGRAVWRWTPPGSGER